MTNKCNDEHKQIISNINMGIKPWTSFTYLQSESIAKVVSWVFKLTLAY